MKTFAIWMFLALCLFFAGVLLSMCGGCAAHPAIPAIPGHGITPPAVTSHGPGSVPNSLTHTATSLDVLIVVGIIALAAGVALFFTLPESHRLSLSLAGSGGSLFGVSVLLRVSLWVIPWVAGGLGIVAVLALAYEVYVNRKALSTPFTISTTAVVKDAAAPFVASNTAPPYVKA